MVRVNLVRVGIASLSAILLLLLDTFPGAQLASQDARFATLTISLFLVLILFSLSFERD
jgi:hypothetical protein